MNTARPSSVEPISTSIVDSSIELRRRLHRIPEVGFTEHKTSALLREELERIGGLDIRTGIARTGIVADLHGDRPGPRVALRADIDALPITEETGVDYLSEHPGRMHACGHDGHMAALLGAAKALSLRRNEIRGSVRFLFQPAEEGFAGAKFMIEDGALDGVDAIFGFHGWPDAPFGHICSNPATLMAGCDPLSVTLHGKGGHAAAPHRAIDPVPAAAQIITALQSVPSRMNDPLDSVVISICMLEASNAHNVIPDRVKFEGSIRTLSPATRAKVRIEADRVVHGIAGAFGLTAEIEQILGYPPVVNDSKLAAFVAETASRVVGSERVIADYAPTMGAEDFSFYLEKVPGVFWFLGMNRGPGTPGLHTPRFDFRDEVLETAISMHVTTALSFLERESAR